MLPTSQLPETARNSVRELHKPPRRYRLRPPGESLQTTRSKFQLARVTTQYSTNPFTLVTNYDQLRKACSILEQAEAVGLDCETTDLDPYKGDIRLTQLSDDQHTYVIDHKHFHGPSGYQPLKQLLESSKPRTICHHSKFEQKWLLHKLGIRLGGIFDSMLASQLIDFNRKSHNLATLAKTYLGIELDKSLQSSDWTGDLSENQLQYAVRDSQVLPALRRTLIKTLSQDALIRAAQLEFEAVPTVADIELAGIYLDLDRWNEQLTIVTQQHQTLAAELQEMLAAGAPQGTLFGHTLINLDAHPQILTALKLLNIPIDRSTKNNVLLPLAKDFPVIAKLLEYRPLSKALTSYGESWFSAINPFTNRVHPDFNQIGAPTGRFSCTDPNIQQVPHANGYRRCFRAPEGRRFCIVDYSQIELRIIAEFSQDPGFLAAFHSGVDLHRTTASQVFNVRIDQVSPDQRDFAKRLNFGVVYGIGAPRFANMTGMSIREAEATLRRYFETYRLLDTYLRDTAAQALEDRQVRTGSGRLVRYRFDPKNKEQVSSTRRKARNARIQGTGSDILKRALRLVGEELRGTSAQIVNIIHDEMVVEVDAYEAEDIGQRVSIRMVQAGEEYLTTIPVKAEPQITTEWIKD
jgi:DNA polymerase-1